MSSAVVTEERRGRGERPLVRAMVVTVTGVLGFPCVNALLYWAGEDMEDGWDADIATASPLFWIVVTVVLVYALGLLSAWATLVAPRRSAAVIADVALGIGALASFLVLAFLLLDYVLLPLLDTWLG